ncbi:MAG: hypothetical protein ACRC1K_18690, partial [Planctomycetia bacterium]
SGVVDRAEAAGLRLEIVWTGPDGDAAPDLLDGRPATAVAARPDGRAETAELLRRVDVFLDWCEAQAERATPLEAAACGAAPVVVGPWRLEAAEPLLNDVQCLIAGGAPDAVADAVIGLLTDGDRLRRMQRSAMLRAAEFSAARAAAVLADVLHAIAETAAEAPTATAGRRVIFRSAAG